MSGTGASIAAGTLAADLSKSARKRLAVQRKAAGLCLNCGHKPMEHGKIVARRWEEPNPCSKCDCYELMEA